MQKWSAACGLASIHARTLMLRLVQMLQARHCRMSKRFHGTVKRLQIRVARRCRMFSLHARTLMLRSARVLQLHGSLNVLPECSKSCKPNTSDSAISTKDLSP